MHNVHHSLVVSRDWIRGRDRMQLGAANRVTCSANEVLYPVKWDRMLVKGSWGVHSPTSWTRFVWVDISKTRHARALIFSGNLYLNGPNKSSSKGMWSRHCKGVKNERSFEKMNSDYAERDLFPEWATFLKHSRRNFADRITGGRAISPNLCTMTFGTPCINTPYPL